MTVRMDAGLKASFDALCSQFGMSANTAMNIFANAVVQRRRIPFEVGIVDNSAYSRGMEAFRQIREKVESGELPSLTIEEINEEIRQYREGK